MQNSLFVIDVFISLLEFFPSGLLLTTGGNGGGWGSQPGTGAEDGDERCGCAPGGGDRAEHGEKLTCPSHPEL